MFISKGIDFEYTLCKNMIIYQLFVFYLYRTSKLQITGFFWLSKVFGKRYPPHAPPPAYIKGDKGNINKGVERRGEGGEGGNIEIQKTTLSLSSHV